MNDNEIDNIKIVEWYSMIIQKLVVDFKKNKKKEDD